MEVRGVHLDFCFGDTWMKLQTTCLLALLALVVALGAADFACAEAVDGTWLNAVGFGDGPIWNAESENPIVGEDPNDPGFGTNDADQEMIYSPFTPITLANPGDKMVFTGSVELAGTINSPLTSGTPRSQFRFGLFQNNASVDQTGWVGYFMHNKHGNAGGTPFGALGVKPVGNTTVFLSTMGATTLQSQQGDGTAASLFNDGTYELMMSIERNATGELVLNSSIVGVGERPPLEPYDPGDPPPSPGSNEFSQIMSTTHADAATLGTYTFDRLGFLMGGNLDADRAAYMNLEVEFIPGGDGLDGDYNDDGTVDAADYVVWRKDPDSFGGDPAGYNTWASNFGAGGGAGSVSLAVPEPGTIIVAALAACLLLVICRRPRLVYAPVGIHPRV
jgi:hypothetical protein